MANLTLVVDDDLLKRARVRALEEGTSVNSVVREQLTRYVAAGDDLRSSGQALVDLSHKASGSRLTAATWTRGELYER